MDIDGTLTDGHIYYGPSGELFKRFGVKDGMGITLLRKANIKTAFLTSENSPINDARANKLKIDKVVQDSRNKTGDIKQIAKSLDIELSETAFMGDDVNDLHALGLVGFSACPANSSKAILEKVDYISNYQGGTGAVREVCEMILQAQDKPVILQENW
jgi:YrbI family 3-deoxy-D-manno-octulosonate 8-phosphate phosphatase